jgi:hypothetical protein
MMATRLLKRIVPVAVIGTTVGLLGVSSGDNRDDGKDHDRDRDKDCDKDKDGDKFCFKMVRSAAIQNPNPNCLANASARVMIKSLGPVEEMEVDVRGLPPNTDFDFFVIQVPNATFGMSWYQGDIDTDAHGRGHGKFIGRFSEETFIVALPPSQPAPVVHDATETKFPDANMNPTTNPIHTAHVGLWFNSPADAVKAGCAGGVTPFNGDHTAGIQVLSSRNFPDREGPLLHVKP